MIWRQVIVVSIGLVLMSFAGCHSIHSAAVRDLLQKEGAKIDAAQANIDLFQKETEARVKFLEQARGLGRPIVDGLQMLIGQAEPSFQAFFGQWPPADVDVRALALESLGP